MRHVWRLQEGGFTFVELLVVVMMLGILVLAALPNYFGADGQARTNVRRANIRAINAAIALFMFRNNGTCPTADGSGSGVEIDVFLADPLYFPDGAPLDPVVTPPATTPYITNYQIAPVCRVVIP